MKKMNNRGFMLVEALVVCTFVVSVLIYFYVQFKNVDKSFDTSYTYDTINGLYAVNNVSNYLDYLYDNDTTFKGIIDNNNVKEAPYYKIIYNSVSNTDDISCSSTTYCTNLMESINAKRVMLVDATLDNLLTTTTFNSDTNYSEKLRAYIKQVRREVLYDSDYRIIIEFNDDTFASLAKVFEASY